MMNSSTANKNHVPYQTTWAGQNGWSTASSQENLINQHPRSHHLGLGPSSEQRTLYNLSHSNQICESTLTPRNNNPHTAMYNDPRMSNITLCSLLYDNTAIQSSPHLMSFAQQSPHTSSVMMGTNQEKAIPSSSTPQQNHGPQPCGTQDLPIITPNNSLKALFERPIPCPSNRPQEFPVSLQSCDQLINATQTTFGGQHVESAGVAGYSHSTASSSTSQEQHHWAPSSHRAVNRPVSGGALNLKKEASQKETEKNADEKSLLINNDRSRSAILQQRALLLEQLERMDKLLQSLPPDDIDDEIVPETPETNQMDTSDGFQIQLPEKEGNEKDSAAEDDSDQEADPDYMPQCEGSDSDCPSDRPCDTGPQGSPSTPETETKPLVKEEVNQPEEKSITPPKKKSRVDKNGILKSFVLSTSTLKVKKGLKGLKAKNYCLFCSRPFIKLARHLASVHSDKPEVAVAFQYPMLSKERREIWNKLLIEGNFAHNKTVLRTGQGQLAVRKRPSITTKAVDFVHCIYCHGLFKKLSLYRHMAKCRERAKTKDPSLKSRKGIISRSVLSTIDCEDLGLSQSMRDILCNMNYDDVSRAIMADRIILQYGEQMCEEQSYDAEKYPYIKQHLRHTARLMLEARKGTSMQNMEDFFHPSNFQDVVSVVNVLTGYNADKKEFRIPSLAIKLGYNLQKTCSVAEASAVESGDTEAAQSAREFMSLFKEKWSELISIPALKNLRDVQQKNKKRVPFAQFAEDMKLLHTHMENVHRDAEKQLTEALTKENFAALARIVLARTICFNKREIKEVSTMTIAAFMSRKKSDDLDNMDVSVSDVEKSLCGFFTRVDIRGGAGRLVPIFLKPSLESSIELLVKVREQCGIVSNNPFIFARAGILSCYRGDDCIRKVVKDCGAKNPSALTPKNMRKRYTKILRLVNLDEDEVKQIFGHNDETLQDDDDDDDDDSGDDIESGEEEAGGATGRSRDASGTSHGHHQTHTKPTSCKMAAPRKSGKQKQGRPHRGRSRWGEAEVRAVEKHMMRFIKRHKVPQKDDCVQCLEAEPRALETRSWRDVKNFVRTRIVALQRQNGSSRDLSENEKEPTPTKPQQENGRPHRGRSRWGEAEVRAVEKHMMRFIKRHKVPQKDDCVQCLEAEPRALETRSWRDVKNFVRTRIVALQRQNGFSRDLSESEKEPPPTKPRQENAHTGVHHKGKLKWDSAEVQAVEKHMMHFIKEQKLPQKDDCVRCLDAEPRALEARSWKGIKDYVRNRITSLQRQNGFSKSSSKKQSRSKQTEHY